MGEELTYESMRKLLIDNNANIRNEVNKDIICAKVEIMKSVNENLVEVNKRIENLELMNTEKEGKIKLQDERILNLEVELRKRNIVLYKLSENESISNPLETVIVRALSHHVEGITHEHIERSFRMGRPASNTTRPVLVSFTSLKTKEKIMQNISRLTKAGLVISEDYPKEIKEKRRVLVPIMKTLKNENHKASIRLDKLFVDGKVWTQEDIDTFQQQTSESAKRKIISPEGSQSVRNVKKLNLQIPANKRNSTKDSTSSTPSINSYFSPKSNQSSTFELESSEEIRSND